MEKSIGKFDSILLAIKDRFEMNQRTIQANLIQLSGEINEFPASKNEIIKENKKLFEENQHLLKLQRDFELFLLKFKEPISKKTYDKDTNVIVQEITIDECFEMTINGLIPIDEYHPMIEDPYFFNQVLAHLQKLEKYEQCARIKKYFQNQRLRVA